MPTRHLSAYLLSLVALIAAAAFGLFEWSLHRDPSAIAEARTIAANTVIVLEVAYLFACRSLTLPLWRIGLLSNRWVWVGSGVMLLLQLAWTYVPLMNRLFHTAPIHWTWWLAFTAAGLVVFALVEVKKLLAARA